MIFRIIRFFCALLLLLLIEFSPLVCQAQSDAVNDPFAKHWVDSVYNQLNTDQRIAQLIMIRAFSESDSAEILRISSLIKQYNLGGICFFQGGPVRQAILTNYYRKLAATPLFIAMDAEWGPAMRLDSVYPFARQMTLGAMANENLIAAEGTAIAQQLKILGVNINFSPVADINSNPANPVINIRSFGQFRDDVARKSILLMNAQRKEGILTVAKHFPGHGATSADSHHTLPFIDKRAKELDSLELYPFKSLISAGVDGMMIGHLEVPAFDKTKNQAASLSPNIINDLLRKQLGFNGLVFTDALDMKGVTGQFPSGKLELRALQAGNDVLLLTQSVGKAVFTIHQAIDSGWYPESELEWHCKRVLYAKYNSGLHNMPLVPIDKVLSGLNQSKFTQLGLAIYSNAVTLIQNQPDQSGNATIPIIETENRKIASLMIGYTGLKLFQQKINDYADVTHFTLPRYPDKKAVSRTIKQLRAYDLILIGINNTIPAPARNYGVSDAAVAIVDSLLATNNCVLNLFTLPYAVNLFANKSKSKAITIAYQDNDDAYNAVVQMLFGAVPASGILPVEANINFPAGFGLKTNTSGRLRYLPYNDPLADEQLFRKIDSLIEAGIAKKAYPGCQLLVAHKGSVILRKNYGYSDYSKLQPVTDSSLYDLASVTKVAATTLAVMKLYDENKVNLDEPLSVTLPFLKNTNKDKITLRQVMTHQAGLVAWIPFYKETLTKGFPDTTLYSGKYTPGFTLQVADNLYLRNDYKNKLLESIVESPVQSAGQYKYSDLGFILTQLFVEQKTGMPIDVYVTNNFYKPLGINGLTFKPLQKSDKQRIMPTENDTVFRHQLIRGYVHDQAAAMMGGVAGHAGLFGTANDMAVLLQMLLQDGYYGGIHYLKPETVKLFTSRQFKNNRRGLGFDKPQLNPVEAGPASEEVPGESFGHTGFTGTYIWADPVNDLSIVFLSNRVNPNAEPNKLVQLGTRTLIQETLYKALAKSQGKSQPVLRKPVNSTY